MKSDILAAIQNPVVTLGPQAMKYSALKSYLSAFIAFMLLSTSGIASAEGLKPTMKQMRLHYKQALEAQSAESFNEELEGFKKYLSKAQAYNFSPERKEISLEGLNKVESFVEALPQANDKNLASLQEQFKKVDQLRKEYHKKAKPGTWDLLMSIFK